MGMECAVRQVGDVIILDLAGRLSLGDALGLGHGCGVVLHEMVCEQIAVGQHKILLNLREVSYMDSHGLGDLVACFAALRDRGGQLRICNPTERIQALLRLTNMDAVLNVHQDEATALQAFTQDRLKTASAE